MFLSDHFYRFMVQATSDLFEGEERKFWQLAYPGSSFNHNGLSDI